MTGRPPRHGTRARYQRELRSGLVPCDRCTAANTAATRAQRARLYHTGPNDLWPVVHVLAVAMLGYDPRPPAGRLPC